MHNTCGKTVGYLRSGWVLRQAYTQAGHLVVGRGVGKLLSFPKVRTHFVPGTTQTLWVILPLLSRTYTRFPQSLLLTTTR
jgi:hypothetical protein